MEKFLLWIITVVMSTSFIIYMWKYSYGQDPPKYFRLILGTVTFGGFIFFSYLFAKLDKITPFTYYDVSNFIGLMIAFSFMQGLRSFLDQLDTKSRVGHFDISKRFLKKNLADLFKNITLFFGIYVIILYVSVNKNEYWFYAVPGYLLSILSVMRILKFRIIDDLFHQKLNRGESVIRPSASVATTLLQGVYNLLFRAYFMIALSFACIYLLIYFDTNPTGERPFTIMHASNNLLVDFIYFSVVTMSTVGYGDILPVAVLPKLVSIFQILLGYFFIGSSFSYIFFVLTGLPGATNKAPPTEERPKQS